MLLINPGKPPDTRVNCSSDPGPTAEYQARLKKVAKDGVREEYIRERGNGATSKRSSTPVSVTRGLGTSLGAASLSDISKEASTLNLERAGFSESPLATKILERALYRNSAFDPGRVGAKDNPKSARA